MHANMKIFLCAFTFILCMYSCKSKMLSEVQHAELIEAIELYKITNGKYPQNKNAFFFQEIIPYLGKRSLFSRNIKQMYVNLSNDDSIAQYHKIPMYYLCSKNGKPIKCIAKPKVGFDFQIDTSSFIIEGNFFEHVELIRDSFGIEFNVQDTMNNDYYFAQQIFFLKNGINDLLKVLEEYKIVHNTYPRCCGKYFINYLLLFVRDDFVQSWPHDFLVLEGRIKVPIYRTLNSSGNFPYLSYCFDKDNNDFVVYYTGKNKIDEMGLGDDVLLH